MQEEQQNDNTEGAGWVFKPGSTGAVGNPARQPIGGGAIVNWSASEYIANPKNSAWFIMLGLSTILLSTVVYFITKDLVSVVVIAVLGVILGVFAARQPQTLEYSLDASGIHMGPKFYPYGSFKSFSVVQDGAFNHISLLPLKRFMPPLSIHYPPETEEKVVNTLADYLPYEENKPDLIENLSRRVRF